MKNILMYKGYSARVYYDPEDKVFVGDVLGLPEDMITFEGEDVETLERRFRESVEAYLEDCAHTGRKPVKPYSGRILLRMPPEVHAALARLGASKGVSLNTMVSEILAREVEKKGASA